MCGEPPCTASPFLGSLLYRHSSAVCGHTAMYVYTYSGCAGGTCCVRASRREPDWCLLSSCRIAMRHDSDGPVRKLCVCVGEGGGCKTRGFVCLCQWLGSAITARLNVVKTLSAKVSAGSSRKRLHGGYIVLPDSHGGGAETAACRKTQTWARTYAQHIHLNGRAREHTTQPVNASRLPTKLLPPTKLCKRQHA